MGRRMTLDEARPLAVELAKKLIDDVNAALELRRVALERGDELESEGAVAVETVVLGLERAGYYLKQKGSGR